MLSFLSPGDTVSIVTSALLAASLREDAAAPLKDSVVAAQLSLFLRGSGIVKKKAKVLNLLMAGQTMEKESIIIARVSAAVRSMESLAGYTEQKTESCALENQITFLLLSKENTSVSKCDVNFKKYIYIMK